MRVTELCNIQKIHKRWKRPHSIWVLPGLTPGLNAPRCWHLIVLWWRILAACISRSIWVFFLNGGGVQCLKKHTLSQESKDPGLWCDSHPSPWGHPFPFHHLALSLEIHCPHCKKRSEYNSLMYVLLISYALSTLFCCLSFFITLPFHLKFTSF